MSATAIMRPAPGRPEASLRRWWDWADRFAGPDPGLNRFLFALEVAVSIAAALGAVWIFAHFTNPLYIDVGVRLAGPQAAAVHAQHYEFLVLAMVIGGFVAQMMGSVMTDPDVKGQLVSSLFIPIPMIVGLGLGLSVNAHRVLSLVLLVVIQGGSTYSRQFGHRWARGGIPLLVGYLIGFLSQGAVALSGLGWLAAEVGLGAAVGVVVHLVFFNPGDDKTLARIERSYAARSRKVTRLSLAVFDDPGSVAQRRLRRHLVRLNEAALIIDGQLARQGALAKGASAQRLHERIFDIELALTNMARFAQTMSRLDLPESQRRSIRRALAAICENDLPAATAAGRELSDLLRAAEMPEMPAGPGEQDRVAVVVPHRFAGTVIALADALGDWSATGRRDPAGSGDAAFRPTVRLAGGWLVGSAAVSAQALTEAGRHRWDRVRLNRVTIQMTVATAVAVIAGDALSGARFYWAVIAVMAMFFGANNAGEQIRKGIFRVAGTVVGVGVGIGLAHAVGHHTNWAIVVVLLGMFLGFYLTRVNYAFFLVGLIAALSQAYFQTGEFTNALLVTRLEETALGAAIGFLTLLVILPLSTREVLRVALRRHLAAMAILVGHATEQLLDGDAATALRSDARALDDADQTLIATAEPLRRYFFGELDGRLGIVVGLAGAYRNYGRNLVTDLAAARAIDDVARADLRRAGDTLNLSIAALLRAVDGPRDGAYVRSAALFDRVERDLQAQAAGVHHGQLAIRDLKLIDEAMAGLAAALTMGVTDYDTSTVG